jgi:RNA recognition motif-containing protein
MTNIFIANLDWSITSDDLMTTFSSFGEVNYAHVVFDSATKKSKGFGYVEMLDTDAAINAIQALNGMEINGRKLDVKIASPKSNRPKPAPKKEPENKPFKPREGQNFHGNKDFQKKPFSGERKPYSGERKPYSGESKPYTGERKPYTKREND